MKQLIHSTLLFVLGLIIAQPLFAAKNISTYLNLSLNQDDIIDDNKTYYQLALSSKWTKGINRHSNFTTRGKISTKQYQDSDTANRNELELQLAYNYQGSNGYFSPIYSVQFKAINSQGSNNYETDKLSLSLIRRQPISNIIELSLGYKIQDHSGTENRTVNSLFINSDFNINYQTIIYVGLNIADETIDIPSNTASFIPTTSPSAARSDFIAAHHSVSEQGANNANLNSVSSDNTSFSVGLIYQIDSSHAFDILLMQNSYKSSTTLNNTIISIDYFYKF